MIPYCGKRTSAYARSACARSALRMTLALFSSPVVTWPLAPPVPPPSPIARCAGRTYSRRSERLCRNNSCSLSKWYWAKNPLPKHLVSKNCENILWFLLQQKRLILKELYLCHSKSYFKFITSKNKTASTPYSFPTRAECRNKKSQSMINAIIARLPHFLTITNYR